MYTNLLQLINDYDKIIIFRHLNGDGDALGSQWGLYYYLKSKYPNKSISVVGEFNDSFKDIFPKPHALLDNDFKDSLAIILDTANTDRIDEQRYKLCDKVVKIDHHINNDQYGDLNIVDENISSASELLANILESFEKKPLNKKAAHYLYIGIISDTQFFKVGNVNENTFKTASFLAKSKIDIRNISLKFSEVSKQLIKIRGILYSQINFEINQFAYLKVTNNFLNKEKMTHLEAKRFIDFLNNIEDIEIWATLTQQKEDSSLYDISLRSKKIVINTLAEKYGGGGHKHACGIKGLNIEQINNLFNDIKSILKAD